MRLLSLIVVALVFALSVPVQADFAGGMKAYKTGAYTTAYQKWKDLAAQGDVKAQNNLGILYRRGLGVKKNPKEAAKWYKLAADQGFAKAQFNLGLMYKRGNGVEKDLIKAIDLYQLSARNGYSRAQFALGLRYERGEGVKQNQVKALKWLNLAITRASGKFRRNVATARERISEGLSDAEIQEATDLADEFRRNG